MLRQPTSWTTIPTDQLRFGFVDTQAREVYLLGYSENDFAEAGLSAMQCPFAPKLFLLRSRTEPFLNMNVGDGFDGDVCGVHELFQKTDRRSLFVWPIREAERLWKKAGLAYDVSLPGRVMLHELFHERTMTGTGSNNCGARDLPNTYPSRFENSSSEPVAVDAPIDCKRDSRIRAALDEDMGDLSRFDTLDSRSANYRTEVAVIARQIVSRRERLRAAPEGRSCLAEFSGNERFEGVAEYFSRQLARSAGLSYQEDISSVRRSSGDRRFFEYGFAFWYGSGSRFCEMLNVLDPSGNWQTLIQSGMSPEEALRRILSVDQGRN